MPTYTVRSGDTLSAIAARYDTRVARLATINGIRNPNLIQVGQQLRLPGSSDTSSFSPSRPAPKPMSIPGRDLQIGMQGPEVRQLQAALVRFGAMSPAQVATGPGVFGPRTQAGVRNFQARYGVPATGYYGPMTRAAMTRAPGGARVTAPQRAPAPQGTSQSAQRSIAIGRSLIGRAYGDLAAASAQPVGRNSWYMHCAQFVNAVYPDLPASAPQLHARSIRGAQPRPGDVVTSGLPAPWGHVGIMTERGTILHSIPGPGVHESSRAAFEQYSPITGVVRR